jgi:polysaccharide biosynthesis transport protein
MSEEFQEQEAQAIDLSRYVDLVRRRHIQFLIPLFVGWLLVWGSSWFLQARYVSSTLILVEEPTMPKNYVTPNVNDDLQSRLQSISQQILSRTRLLLIINNLNLYSQKKDRPLTPDDKVELMRKDIEIELVRDRDQSITAFRINYSGPNPAIAQEVTSKLTNLFIDENVKVRQQLSQDTTQFIQTQLEAARQSLAAQEAKIRVFQAAHQGELPTQQSTNLQILSGLQAQYQNEQQALNTAKQQRIYFQTMVDQYHTLQRSTSSGDGTPNSLAGVDQQLEKMRAQLTELSSHYTDSYPDVQQLKSQIAKTEKIRNNLIAELKNNAAKQGSATGSHETVDPIQNPTLIQLQGQLHSSEVEITNREQAIAALNARIGEYQRRLNEEPASEQQLADLTRGYEQSKTNYDELLKKENESRMATNMEQLQQGERFTILDPPSLPLKPAFPNRLKMCGMGFVVGVILGALIVGILEFLDDRLHSDKEIKKLLPASVISEVPEVLTVKDQHRSTRRIVFGWAMAALVLICILAGSAFSYLHS